ncbi:thymidine kinase [Altererythrobacter aerius]|uniref:Thymidine kinase n=1 Tax=Tsuneonella aeria TaxID=1837929 RepID=A0A6I4TGU2_9SPHN|nr:thymidine kinase [Tsuneonella aeria]MXO75886.1 thymidine kinase [Tsuneonella aeria]
MARLYFYYASMNAGKSSTLLQADFNYRERGMRTMLWTAALDSRSEGMVRSRIGLEADARLYTAETDLWEEVARARPIDCILIDEAQFLTPAQVWQCARLADEAGVPVVCYGLRTDFRGDLFPGSAALLGIADKLVELKGVCHCGRKATMNLRVDAAGKAVSQGEQTEVGGNERYVALCRRHFSEALGRTTSPA